MAFNYTTREGDTVDYVAWKHYGRQDGQVVEQVLEANKDISNLGPTLPAGVTLVLPDIKDPEQVQGVRLWD